MVLSGGSGLVRQVTGEMHVDAGADLAESFGAVVVGILADPEGAPAEVGRHLVEVLPDRLSERFDDGRDWTLRVRYERLPGGELGTHDEMLVHGSRRRVELGWDLVVCVTDLPLRDGKRPLVADVASARGVAVVSLPGFGATRLRRRVTDVVRELVVELATGADEAEPDDGGPLCQVMARDLPGPFRVVAPEAPDIDARVVATRGRWRLLVGMVRDNRPWRLLFGLRATLASTMWFSAACSMSRVSSSPGYSPASTSRANPASVSGRMAMICCA